MKKTQPIAQLITKITKQLAEQFTDHTLCQQYAWWTVETITQKTQSQLIAHNEIILTNAQHQQLTDWLKKLIQEQMPIQYLIGSVPFNDLEILVKPPILIPRPETEEWCLNLIAQLKQLKNKNLTIFEPCTGSGCIALALAHALPTAIIYATDTSPQAIDLAQKNACHNKISNVTFIQSDLFAKLPKKVQADLIIVNPPYITEKEWAELDTSVTHWEDKNALIAEHDGLAIIEKIIKHAIPLLRTNDEMQHKNIPQLAIEIGYQQAYTVANLMEQAGYNAIHLHKDLEKKYRVVSGRIDYVATTAP